MSDNDSASSGEVINDADDIDALLDASNEDEILAEAPVTDNADVSDPDDIDALLDSINDKPAEAAVADNADVSDPDDIDALLDSINDEAGRGCSSR